MKFFKKTTLNTAVSAALIAGSLLSSNVALAYDNLDAQDPISGSAYVNKNGMGQALVYPYYTVEGGFKTTFNVFNTSDDNVVAVKVRFREYQNSRDVLDFNLLLSPNDKWSANVISATQGVKADGSADANYGGAILKTSDTSCTVPFIPTEGVAFNKIGYTYNQGGLDFVDSGSQDLERLTKGYIEIIPMAWAPANGPASAVAAVHNDGDSQPAGFTAGVGCGSVIEAFKETVDVWDQDTTVAPGNGAPTITNQAGWVAIPDGINPLFGELALINEDGGVAGGTNAVAIADWMAGESLLTAQQFPYFLEPTLATAAGTWDSSLLDEVDLALNAVTVTNEWSDNPLNGADTDWVMTFPTKSFHADVDSANIQAGNNTWRTSDGTPAGTRPLLAPFAKVFAAGMSETALTVDIYDSEERTIATGGSVSFSPGSLFQTDPQLRFESNVISFTEDTDGTGNVLKVTDSGQKLVYPAITNLGGGTTNGHLTVGFKDDASAAGLPVVGFAFKERDLGMAERSYGQVLDHKYNAD